MQFKCKSTNLIYNFEFEVDIQSMLKHPDYEAVSDNEAVAEKAVKETHKPTAKSTKKQAKVTPDESNIDGA